MRANQCMTVVLPFLLLLLLLLPPQRLQTRAVPIVIASRTEQQAKTIALDSPFETTSSNFEGFQFGHQDSHRQTGFILPSSLRTLYIKGPALAQCKSACRLVLRIINKTDEASPGMESSHAAKSCSLKSLMIFSGLNAGKYRLTTSCHDVEQLCYTDPGEKVFEVTINDSETEVVHLGSLLSFMRPQRHIAEEQTLDTFNGGYYASAYDVARQKYWHTLVSIGVISSLVAVGLALISCFTSGER